VPPPAADGVQKRARRGRKRRRGVQRAPTPAQRPAYSVLDKGATWRDLAIDGVHWRRQLRLMLHDLKEQGE